MGDDMTDEKAMALVVATIRRLVRQQWELTEAVGVLVEYIEAKERRESTGLLGGK